MRSTGIVRKIDELGRIVIPKEIRRSFGIQDNLDSMEIFIDDNMIILKKYEPSCIFCNDASDVVYFKGRMICKNCLKELGEL